MDDAGVLGEDQAVISSITELKLNFGNVEKVARSWIIDFSFLSLCRYYREQNSHKFSKTLRAFEAMIDEEFMLQDDQTVKRTICCFLSRIMDGKNLDVHYDLDNKVTPLMSALFVWEYLKDVTSDAALYENITNLLFIQSIGVCLEKGNTKLAAHTLQWLEKEGGLPQKLQRMLTTVISKNDVYDQLLTSFSFNRLLESINTFLDAFLAEHPSDFLFKSASKVVQACQERTEQDQNQEEPQVPKSSDNPERNDSKTVSSELNLRPKKRLLSSRSVQAWKPETTKKTQCVLPRTTELSVSSRIEFKFSTPEKSKTSPKYRGKKMWLWDEDQLLKAGVMKYGKGRWTQILKEFDFGSRTSVMLKDRWRTLKKNGLVALNKK